MKNTRLQMNELARKVIHVSSSTIPLIYWFWLDREWMLKGLIFIALGFLTAEYLRFHWSAGRTMFFKIFGAALRHHESVRLTGATYVFTSAVLAVFLFPKPVAVASLLVLSLADTAAALVGIPLGKHRFLKKSLEGSLAFFVVTNLILWWYFPDLLWMLLIAGVVTLAEAYPFGLDDNFVIPLLTGALLLIAGV